MALNHYFLSVEILRYFPQPARPNNNYQNIFESIMPQNRFPLLEPEDEKARIEVDEKLGITHFKGCLADVGVKVHDSLKKLFSKVGNKFPLMERSIREEVQDYRDNVAATNMVQKHDGELNQCPLNDSIIDRSMGKGVKPKMERFKVKTLSLGGVVKKDQK